MPCVAICDRGVVARNEIIDGVGGTRSEGEADHPAGGAGGTFGRWDRLENEALLAAVRRTDDTVEGIRAAQGAQVGVLRAGG